MPNMSVPKPDYRKDYGSWLRKEHSIKLNRPLQNNFEHVCFKAKSGFETSPFWRELRSQLRNYDSLYKEKTGYDLLEKFDPEIQIKTFDSFLLKTYRHNVLNNANWPEAPRQGWWIAPYWLSEVNDIVRTTIVVKYLDGIKYLIDRAKELAQSFDICLRYELQAKPEGYYAAHVYYRREIEIPRSDYDTETRNMYLEIQISTEMKEIIKDLLHVYYEVRRKKPEVEFSDWQWQYDTDEFIASYLGHILHYVEGTIVKLRDRQKESGE